MTSEEFSKFAMALKTYYSRDALLPNAQAMELWFRQLCDIPYEIAEAVLNKWVATNKWSPTIADIRELAVEMKTGTSIEWGEAWETVMRAVRKFGYYQKADALDSLDDITRRCVERVGWNDICMSENIAVERANFRMIYEREIERQKREAQIPQAMRERIEQIQVKMIGGD